MAWYNSGSWGGLKAEGDIKNILSQLCIAVNERESASFTGWKTISTMTRSGSTVTVVTSAAHGYASNDWVKIRGCDQTAYNGDWKITVSNTTTFTFAITGTPTTPTTGTRQVGKPYTLFVYDNDFATKPKPTASDFAGLWLHSCTVNEKTLTSVTCGNSNVLVTHASHGLLVSDYVRVADISETGYNGRRQVVAKSTNTFTYGVPGNPDQVTAVGKYAKELAVSSITRSGSTATATSAGHGFSNGDSVFIDGVTETEYNGTFTIFNVTGDTFDYTVSGTPATPASGALKKCGKWVTPESVECQQDAVATATLSSHRLETDWRVVISGANQTEYNGHLQITKTGDNTFTYPLPLGIPVTPATGTIKVKANVNGCGITRSTSTVAVACVQHGYEVGEWIRISNAEQADYNGFWRIATKTTSSMSFTISTTPATPATPNTGTVLQVHRVVGIGVVIQQLRNAVTSMLAKTLVPAAAAFVESGGYDTELTLSGVLGAGSYGSSWVSIDTSPMDLSLYDQIREALEEMVYMAEMLKPWKIVSTFGVSKNTKNYLNSGVQATQEDSWDSAAANTPLDQENALVVGRRQYRVTTSNYTTSIYDDADIEYLPVSIQDGDYVEGDIRFKESNNDDVDQDSFTCSDSESDTYTLDATLGTADRLMSISKLEAFFAGTPATTILQDSIPASHPFGALAVGEISYRWLQIRKDDYGRVVRHLTTSNGLTYG